MTKARKRILIAVLLSLIAVLAAFSALKLYTSAQEPVWVSIEPSELTVTPGYEFWVDVVCQEISGPLDAFDIIVNYDRDLMDAMDVVPGPTVPLQDLPLFSYDLDMWNAVHFWDLPTNGWVLSGDGVFARIHFMCTARGSSSIIVNPDSMFFDPQGTPIPILVGSHCLVDQTYPEAHTYVQPPSTTVPLSTSFTVDVNVWSVTNLWKFELTLNYNTRYVDAIDIIPGSFLPLPIIDREDIYDLTGTICFNVHAGIGEGTSGDGTLATITFHCTGAGESILTLTSVNYYDPLGYMIPTTTVNGRAIQFAYWEPNKLQDIVELPYTYALVDLPFVPPGSPQGYAELRSFFESKGYMFEVNAGSSWWVQSFFDVYTEVYPMQKLGGTITSWWSTNTLANGTKACLLSAEMEDGTSMAMGFTTNVLPPEQMPGVDPYIIWNAEPYFFIQFYWWSWNPVNRIVTWSYWWHDSHNHPNWFWGPYWWWRTYTKAYYLGYWPPVDVNWVYWRPWWGWWWHWVYWQHWHWWSAYFPYDP